MSEQEFLVSGKLRVFPLSEKVVLEDKELVLTGLTYRLLLALLRAEGQRLTTEQLAEQVWQQHFVSAETVSQRVSILRKALGKEYKAVIESARGEGYRWVLDVQAQAETIDKLQNTDNQPDAQPTKSIASWSILAWLSCVLLAIIALYFGYMSPATQQQAPREDPKVDLSHNTSLILQRAFHYAEQNTQHGNGIAIELFRNALESQPGNLKAKSGLAAAVLAQVAKFNGSAELLLESDILSADVLHKQPDDWRAYWLRGYYYDVLGELDNAILYYEKAMNIDGASTPSIASDLAYLYVRKGRLHEAMHLNVLALEGPSMYKVLQIAEILHLADLEPTATKWMESAFQLAPDDNFTQVQYAQKLWCAGDTELATSVLVNKHEREQATVDSLLLLALISMQAKDLARALEATSHAVQLSPNSVYSQSLHYWLLKTHFDDDASSPQLESFGEQHWPNQYVARSIMHLAERQKGAAIDALRTAAELGYLDYQYLLYAMPFQQLKDEPDFQSIIDDIMHSVSTERTKIQAMQLPDINVLMQAE